MINETIENVVECIREARDEAESFGEQILFFVAFITIGLTLISVTFIICALVFSFPKVVIPIYLSIFILWQGYKRL